MPHSATTLNDHSPSTQDPHVTPATHTPTSSSPASSTGKFRFISDAWALDRLRAVKRDRGRTLRGCPKTALALFVELKRRADRNGHFRTSNDQLAPAIDAKDRHTVCAAAILLVEAELIDLPVRTYDRTGHVDGLDYALRFDPAYGATVRQQDLPLKSSTTKSSSALRAPRRPQPLEPATPEQLPPFVWEIVNFIDDNPEAMNLQPLGIDTTVPDNLPDLAMAVRTLMTARTMTATEDEIRDAIAHVEREHWRKHQLPLPMWGVARKTPQPQTAMQARQARDEARRIAWLRRIGKLDPVQTVPDAPNQTPQPQTPRQARQTPPRTTIGGAGDRSVGRAPRRQQRPAAAIWAVAAVSAEERDRQRVADEKLRADVVAAVMALPLDGAAALREAARPELDERLQHCPGLDPERARPVHEHNAIVGLVLQSLRGRSIDDTIAALIAEVRSRPAPIVSETAPDLAARFAELRRRARCG